MNGMLYIVVPMRFAYDRWSCGEKMLTLFEKEITVDYKHIEKWVFLQAEEEDKKCMRGLKYRK